MLAGLWLSSGSGDFTVKIWNPDDGSLIRTLIGHVHWVRSLAVLKNGSLASGCYDNTIKIWDPNTGTLIN